MSAMAGPAWSSEPPTNWMVEREGGLKRELGWPAWVNTNAYHYIAYLLGGYYEEEEDRQKATSDCHVSNALNSPLAANALWFLYSVAILLLFFLSPTACSRESCSKLKISEALLKCGHQGWCNQAFKKRERDRNNGGWVVVGGYIWHIFHCRSAGSRERLLRTWICMLRMVLLLSLSVWLQLTRTRWCHPEGFVNILDKETKSQGWR